MKIIDTHAHLNFKPFAEDYAEVIKRALKEGVGMINIGSQYSTSQRAIELAEEFGLYAAIGLHPIHLFEVEEVNVEFPFRTRGEEFVYEKYKELAKHDKVVALGECGLDYFHVDVPIQSTSITLKEIKEKQKETLIAHIKLANEVQKPIILHVRAQNTKTFDPYYDVLDILDKHPIDKGAVVHCFNGNLELAREFVKRGCKISFNGLITFVDQWDVVIQVIDLENIMVETDCPYLTPVPHRGERNEPLYVKEVVKHIANIKSMSFEDVAQITTNNAKKFFNI